MPFQFPDPSIQTEVVHPGTGETWHYQGGIWEVQASSVEPSVLSTDTNPSTHNHTALENEIDQNEEQLQAISTTLFNLVTKVESLESLDITNALSALATAQADIIELKSKVNTLELTSFLIME